MISGAEIERQYYLNTSYDLKSWLLTTDHKRLSVLYFIAISIFTLVGSLLAAFMRVELLTPRANFASHETYNTLLTMHGVLMVFFFLIPAIPATFGNFFLPLMLGARRLAFPRLGLLSWYLLIMGGGFTIFAMAAGGTDTGWTFYAPYSTTSSNSHVAAAVIGVLAAVLSSMLTGLNCIVTVQRMRAPGMGWFRMPLFAWTSFAAAAVQLIASPVIVVALVLLFCERVLNWGVFTPALGGDPLLFPRLFWFYAHPAVYVMVLPAVGVTSELISTFSRKPIFGYRLVALSSVTFALLGFFGWGQHLFASGQSLPASLVVSLLSCSIAIPTAITILNWTATLRKGSISFAAPMLYALGFVILFSLGGLAGLFLSALATNVHLADTQFAVAQFHYLIGGGTLMAFLGGLHYWWPKVTGRMYPESWARLSALVVFAGVHLTLLPQFVLGYMGMPSRYHGYPVEFQILNVASTLGATVLGLGCFLPVIYLVWSLGFGPAAGSNPWRASGLEWQTASPPPVNNFDEIPIVTLEAYDYAHVVREAIDVG